MQRVNRSQPGISVITRRQGVKPGAEEDGFAGGGTGPDRRDAVAARTGNHLIRPGAGKVRGDAGGGFALLARPLGKAVQLAPPVGRFGDIGIGQHLKKRLINAFGFAEMAVRALV